jgi:hypothetical protein
MNKKTKTAIAVGVVGIAAYLLYRQSQKNKPFANFTRMSALSTGMSAPSGFTVKAACKETPADAQQFSYAGKLYWPCCGPGVISEVRSAKTCPSDKQQTTLATQLF